MRFKINPTFFFQSINLDSIKYLLIDVFGKSADQLTKTLKNLIMKTEKLTKFVQF